jgi:hypothetical protein
MDQRWALKGLNISKSTFYVKDLLAKKLRVFYVPYLQHVEISGASAYAFTSTSKVMQLDLLCNGRQFLNTTELKSLKLNKKAQAIHQDNI